MPEEQRFEGKLVITGKLVAETGLHIGGAEENLEIGGVDNAVIKLRNGKPYIPGSSLKGKLRALAERKKFEMKRPQNKNDEGFPDGGVHRHKDYDEIYKLFGMPGENAEGSTRLIVRDALLTNESEKDSNDYTEIKAETGIDRLTSKANPRKMERVPAGTVFNFEIIINVLSGDENLIETLVAAMKLLEDDYLGGSGSRGSGKVRFRDFGVAYRQRSYYEGKSKETTLAADTADLLALENNLTRINKMVAQNASGQA